MMLGQVLKEGRLRHGLSLRDVERATQISNGYLSQLETGTVKSPSPNHLHQLAELYGASYALLMELAGYTVPSTSDSHGLPRLEGLGELTTDELAQVRSFIGFLRASRRAGSDGV